MEKQQQQQQDKSVVDQKQKSSENVKKQSSQHLAASSQVLKALHSGAQISELPRRQLEMLSATIGNSSLSDLLAGTGFSPETCSFNCPRLGFENLSANQIEPASPALFDAPKMSRRIEKPWEPFSPGNICDRAVPAANDAEFNGMLLMTNNDEF